MSIIGTKKRWFEDNTRKCQVLPFDVAAEVFGVTEEQYKDVEKNEKFVLIETFDFGVFNVQVLFNSKMVIQNNAYLVLAFDKKEDILRGFFTVHSITQIPPVWNREFGNLDYADFLRIQQVINDKIEECGGNRINYVLSPENKSFYFFNKKGGGKPNQEEIERIRNGQEQYEIFSLFAEKHLDLVEKTQLMLGIKNE